MYDFPPKIKTALPIIKLKTRYAATRLKFKDPLAIKTLRRYSRCFSMWKRGTSEKYARL